MWKLIAAATVILLGVSLPLDSWQVTGVLTVIVFIAHSLAEISLRYVLRRLALFLPMLLMLSASIPLVAGFERGIEVMLLILLRGTLAFLAGLWLIQVLPFPELIRCLARLRVPQAMLASLWLMHRYMLTLWEELNRMRQARRARRFTPPRWRSEWIDAAQLIGMLVIRGFDRADRVHAAMKARGWNGRIPGNTDDVV